MMWCIECAPLGSFLEINIRQLTILWNCGDQRQWALLSAWEHTL